ncbi:hypothetical protein DL93DRAFT_2160085 [Clavulina sp. PMI_390]|nr:hypothetical protein DL93DRAFT_2160085 [Clavulina sp. PMI_390]
MDRDRWGGCLNYGWSWRHLMKTGSDHPKNPTSQHGRLEQVEMMYGFYKHCRSIEAKQTYLALLWTHSRAMSNRCGLLEPILYSSYPVSKSGIRLRYHSSWSPINFRQRDLIKQSAPSSGIPAIKEVWEQINCLTGYPPGLFTVLVISKDRHYLKIEGGKMWYQIFSIDLHC